MGDGVDVTATGQDLNPGLQVEGEFLQNGGNLTLNGSDGYGLGFGYVGQSNFTQTGGSLKASGSNGYSGLQISDSLSLYTNLQQVGRWATDDYIARTVNKKVDKTLWGMTPQTINAYYNPTTNEICFPAAILQPPFFDPEADDAVNYGAIGGVIGHEMSHGFDDQGSQFDKTGNQRDWWTAQDKTNYNARTKVLADYFSAFEALPGVKVNGLQTLGENIGDNGGLNIAFRALQNAKKEKNLGVVDGFTPEQRFFLAWGRVWASNATDEYVKYIVTSDVHSPNLARVNGALPHIDAWYDAFNVKKGNKMYLAKNKRAHIW